MPTRREFLWAAAMAAAAEEKVRIAHRGRTLLEYRYTAERPKPYVHPLCLADGRVLTLDGPPDHIHHRGLMVAWSEVNGIDFWGEDNPARHGQIVHRRFERRRERIPAEIVGVNDWVAEGRTILEERRTIRVPAPSAEGVWLVWITELKAAREPVKLAAGQHVYNGLGIRFVREMDGGSVLNANGTAEIAKANGETARWCAYYHAGAGVALFDHPGNPRHPNAFFVMNKAFGYLSAAPTYRAAFDLTPGESIRFRWGVLAFPGDANAAALERRFTAWTKEGR
jgi:hypothetical protein